MPDETREETVIISLATESELIPPAPILANVKNRYIKLKIENYNWYVRA